MSSILEGQRTKILLLFLPSGFIEIKLKRNPENWLEKISTKKSAASNMILAGADVSV